MTVRSSALLRVVVLLTVAVAALFLLLAGTVGAGSGSDVVTTQQHVVRSGETLWQIARAHTAVGADVRDTVDEIRAMNALDGTLIYPGDLLVVPLFEG